MYFKLGVTVMLMITVMEAFLLNKNMTSKDTISIDTVSLLGVLSNGIYKRKMQALLEFMLHEGYNLSLIQYIFIVELPKYINSKEKIFMFSN